MLTIAAGVCLGILAAVLILNWWQAHLVRRAERRARRAYRKMMRAATMTDADRELAAVDRVIGIGFVIIVFIVAMAYFISPH